MKVFNWKESIDETELNIVASAIANGELIVFPTETVYGIGTDALNGKACKKIFEAKGRPQDNPLIVHVSDEEMLKECVQNINEVEEKLIANFMPGPFTLILEKSKIIPDEVTAGLDTVAIRMPDNEIAKKIIETVGKPIAAPSANISGKPSGTNIDDIKEELGQKVFALVDGGSTQIGLESTVVKVINGIPKILRPGKVTAEEIKKLIGKVEIDEHVLGKVDDGEVVESPGMKHKHYSPKTKCVLLDIEDNEQKAKEITKLVNQNICFVGHPETALKLNILENKLGILEKIDFYSYGEDLEEISKNIFSILRKVDMKNYDLIVIEGVKTEGLGLAIMNRLLRTCEYNVIK